MGEPTAAKHISPDIFALTNGTLVLLDQLVSLLKVEISDSDEPGCVYTRESKSLPGSTIGKHIRHIMDHFRLLNQGIQLLPQNHSSSENVCNDAAAAVVHYASRSRQVEAEQKLDAGIELIEDTKALVNMWREMYSAHSSDLNQAITICDILDSGSKKEVMLGSSVGREIWFCTHHMVHHLAIIKLICGEYGIKLGNDFGYAPSTLVYQKQINAENTK